MVANPSVQAGEASDEAMLGQLHSTARGIVAALVSLRGHVIDMRWHNRPSALPADRQRIIGEIESDLAKLRQLTGDARTQPSDVHALTTAFDGSVVEKEHAGIRGRSYHDIAFKLGESACETIKAQLGVDLVVAASEWIDTIRFRQDRLGQLLAEEYARAVEAVRRSGSATIDALAGQAGSGRAKPIGSAIVSGNEARDKWIYDEARKTTGWKTIVARLKNKPKKWLRISSVSGIKAAAVRYADRHELPLPDPRKAGRKPVSYRRAM
ncbi:MAG TPA: hypothetical protein VGY55_18070 [Pirellulales bacterium]|jgi:hypothetical protein|nr:hypothetical protein [Pirellulales bacterium]